MEPLNRLPLSRELVAPQKSYHFFSDASGSIGCGGIWAPKWFQLKWSELAAKQMQLVGAESITFKELLPIVIACAV